MENEAPERIYADRGPRGRLLYRELRMPDTIAEYVRADLATLSSDAVAGGEEMEPFCWLPTKAAKWIEEYDGPACGTETVVHNRPIKSDGGFPLYAAPPETAQLRERVKELEKALKEAEDLLSDLAQGQSIHNERFPNQRIDGPLWAQIGRVVENARRVREGGKF